MPPRPSGQARHRESDGGEGAAPPARAAAYLSEKDWGALPGAGRYRLPGKPKWAQAAGTTSGTWIAVHNRSRQRREPRRQQNKRRASSFDRPFSASNIENKAT